MAARSSSLMNCVELLNASVIEPNTTACRLRPVLRNCAISASLQRPSPVLGSARRLGAYQPSSRAPARNGLPLSSRAFSLKARPRGVWQLPQWPGPWTM
ncbi:hypothetical protein D3C75_960940 [compost metagenome]